MKNIKLSLLTITLVIFINCSGRQNEKQVESNDTIIENLVKNDTILKGEEIHQYSNYKLKNVAENSESKFLMLIEKGKTLSICCAWENYSNLFGSIAKKDLLRNYNFLEYKEEKFKRIDQEEDQIVKNYLYDNSFLKTYFLPEDNSEVLVSASISSERFILRNNIHIGMRKDNFLEKLFDKADIQSLMKFDTINIGENEMGELEYYYIFNENRLNKIIVDTDFDWFDKELK
jgi:hypothetical protein